MEFPFTWLNATLWDKNQRISSYSGKRDHFYNFSLFFKNVISRKPKMRFKIDPKKPRFNFKPISSQFSAISFFSKQFSNIQNSVNFFSILRTFHVIFGIFLLIVIRAKYLLLFFFVVLRWACFRPAKKPCKWKASKKKSGCGAHKNFPHFDLQTYENLQQRKKLHWHTKEVSRIYVAYMDFLSTWSLFCGLYQFFILMGFII